MSPLDRGHRALRQLRAQADRRKPRTIRPVTIPTADQLDAAQAELEATWYRSIA